MSSLASAPSLGSLLSRHPSQLRAARNSSSGSHLLGKAPWAPACRQRGPHTPWTLLCACRLYPRLLLKSHGEVATRALFAARFSRGNQGPEMSTSPPSVPLPCSLMRTIGIRPPRSQPQISVTLPASSSWHPSERSSRLDLVPDCCLKNRSF